MEFSNLFFLYILLPATLLTYFLMPDLKRKNLVFLVVSLLFYAMGQPLYLGLLVGLSYLNYFLALRINPRDVGTVIVPVALNIAVLALFKYLDFFLGMFGLGMEGGLLLSGLKGLVKWLNGIGFGFAEPKTVLPIGISFYTFRRSSRKRISFPCCCTSPCSPRCSRAPLSAMSRWPPRSTIGKPIPG